MATSKGGKSQARQRALQSRQAVRKSGPAERLRARSSHKTKPNAALTLPALYRLMTWLSPAYPIGAFSYSSGIEWAVAAGDIVDARTLAGWLAVVIGEGGGFCDAVLFAHAYRAAADADASAVILIAEHAAALAPGKERYIETMGQGRAFLATTRAAWPCSALDPLPLDAALPVAVAVACAGHDIALVPAVHCYLQAFAANLVSAAVRAIPLGQLDGQRVLANLEGLIAATAARALATKLDDIGGAAMRADLASMHHETQYTRLFRS
jgi:urease accessory protein